MEAYVYVLIIFGVALVAFAATVIIRTLRFSPKPECEKDTSEVSFDRDEAIEALRQLVRCKTVSYYSHELEDEAEFEKFYALTEKLYPEVYKACSLTRFDDRGLLFKWEGKSHEHPAVLMSHYDVVPVSEKEWDKAPFDAVLEDGVIWGRGTLDTKVTFNSVLFSANTLIKEGYVPESDIYFAFSGCEEVNGLGAVNIVNYFEKCGIEPSIVLDEGGAVTDKVFPGVNKPAAFVGIAEKGLLDLEYTVKSEGGHASAPPPHTPVGVLADACTKVENRPFPVRLTKPALEMFDTLGRHSSFLYRMIFANLWCFGWLINMICKKNGGDLNALLRTTVAFTQMKGSTTANVIPTEASMVSNMRLNPMDTMDSAAEYIRRTIGNEKVTLKSLRGMNPSPVSETDCDAYKKLSRAIVSTWDGVIVSPYLMMQCSDSRHWGRISRRVYRFSAMDLTKEERQSIHANNERIRVDCALRAVEFYIRLIKLL